VHPDTATTAGGHANRNAGFIRQRQCGSPTCRMNPAFRWWCQDAPAAWWLIMLRIVRDIPPIRAVYNGYMRHWQATDNA
jgi:hypothetical protein